MNRSRTALTALSLVSVLALGACSGDDPEPRFAEPTPTLPSSPSTTPVSGPVEPTMPAAATALDPRGARQFVDYWFAAWSYAMVTGDTSTVEGISDPDCTSCRALFRRVESLYAKGGRVETEGWTVGVSRLNGEFDLDSTSFLLRVEESRQSLFDADKLVDRTPPTKVPMQITLVGADGSWNVSALEIIG